MQISISRLSSLFARLLPASYSECQSAKVMVRRKIGDDAAPLYESKRYDDRIYSAMPMSPLPEVCHRPITIAHLAIRLDWLRLQRDLATERVVGVTAASRMRVSHAPALRGLSASLFR